VGDFHDIVLPRHVPAPTSTSDRTPRRCGARHSSYARWYSARGRTGRNARPRRSTLGGGATKRRAAGPAR